MSGIVVRVLPDVPAIDRSFDYLVPEPLGDQVRVGTMVRVPLSGRRVAGWVLERDVRAEQGVALREIAKIVGEGPPADVVELCKWAAWRWAGRLATMLRLASPERVVHSSPPLRVRPAVRFAQKPLELPDAHTGRPVVIEVSPTSDPLDVVLPAAAGGQLIVITPRRDAVDRLVRGLRASGASAAAWPNGWAAAAGGATAVGGRAAVFAPAPALSAIVVLDEHDPALQSEASPTWHARDVAIERARRAGVPCLLVSPCPSLEALGSQREDEGAGLWVRPEPGAPATPTVDLPDPAARIGAAERRAGWAPVTIIDRRGDDSSRGGLYTSRLVEAVRGTARADGRVLVVLNRTGRARMLTCRSCGTVAECAVCGAAVHQDDSRALVCASCTSTRPSVCVECGSTALSLLRVGVTRAREELEALALEPVTMITASSTGELFVDERIIIGTSAALHRADRADLVVFLDFDQELLAPRYRAAEEALGLLVLANRVLGGRARGGRLLIQTRNPEHEVVQAALRAEPRLVSVVEASRRRLLRFPPAATIVAVGREAAPSYIERFGAPVGVSVQGSDDGRWVLRAEDRELLLNHMAGVERPPGQLKLQVDPARLS